MEKVKRIIKFNKDWLLIRMLNTVEFTDKVAYAAVSDKKIYINKGAFDKLIPVQQYGLLLHEAFHIIFRHSEMRKVNNFEHETYNIACDIVINEHLRRKKIDLPEGGVYRETFGVPKELETSKAIYEYLINQKNADDSQSENEDQNAGNGDQSSENEDQRFDDILDPEEEEVKGELSDKESKMIRNLLVKDGYSLDKEKNLVDVTLNSEEESEIDLFEYIRYYSGRLLQFDSNRSFKRERRVSEGCILPVSRVAAYKPKVKVFVDASGSMGGIPNRLINRIKKIYAKGLPYKAEYFLFDTEIKKYDNNLDDFGGGTDLDLVADNLKEADLYVIITDCQGEMDKLTNSDKNIIVFTNNKRACKNMKTVEVDNDFLFCIGRKQEYSEY